MKKLPVVLALAVGTLTLLPARGQPAPSTQQGPVSRAEYEQLKKDQEELKKEIAVYFWLFCIIIFCPFLKMSNIKGWIESALHKLYRVKFSFQSEMNNIFSNPYLMLQFFVEFYGISEFNRQRI